MNCQLIFCVEANKSSKSDYIYIKNTVDRFYIYNNADIKLSPVYMGGRGNYNKNNILTKINSLISQYKAGTKTGNSIIIYCFDCDNYDSDPQDALFLENARSFCSERGYELVWFCRDIEQVYTGAKCHDRDKKKVAESFAKSRQIKTINADELRHSVYKDKASNLCSVLDKYLHLSQ